MENKPNKDQVWAFFLLKPFFTNIISSIYIPIQGKMRLKKGCAVDTDRFYLNKID